MFRRMALNDRQKRFAEEYLLDLNGTQAAIRAGYSERTAGSQADDLLKKPEIKIYIETAQAKRSAETGIDAAKVLRLLWLRATADPRKLIEYRRDACRHCYGVDHAYQWVDLPEYLSAVEQVERHNTSLRKGAKPQPIPEDTGGYGYTPNDKPHPKCPRCHGHGWGEVHAHDSRDYDEASVALYAGVKRTKDGFEVKMHDQDKNLDMLMRHLGQYKDRTELVGALKHSIDLSTLTDEQLAIIAAGGAIPTSGGS